jgi:hypothetical protein
MIVYCIIGVTLIAAFFAGLAFTIIIVQDLKELLEVLSRAYIYF